jgi:hypothetical protein
MAVDILTDIDIRRPRAEVAAYTSDPDNATAWYVNIKAMETTYTWEDTAAGGTRMTLRNRGEPSGFPRVAAPLMAAAMRRANRKDLARLKSILEGRGSGA